MKRAAEGIQLERAASWGWNHFEELDFSEFGEMDKII